MVVGLVSKMQSKVAFKRLHGKRQQVRDAVSISGQSTWSNALDSEKHLVTSFWFQSSDGIAYSGVGWFRDRTGGF